MADASPSTLSFLALPRGAQALAPVAVILLAGVLLLLQLDAKSLWIDEFITVGISRQGSLSDFVASYLSSERQPPLHYLVLRLWIGVAGTSDFAVRFPWAAFGIATVAGVYALGRRLLGPTLALAAAGLLAASPCFVLYARMARYYSLTCFLAVLSTWLFLLALDRRANGEAAATPGGERSEPPMVADPPAARDRGAMPWLAYTAATALLLFTSYPAAAVPLGHGAYFLATLRRHHPGLRPWLLSQLAVGAVFGTWLLLMAVHIARYPAAATIYMPRGWKALVLELLYPLYSFSLGETIFPWHPVAVPGALLTGALAIAGLWALRRQVHALALTALLFVFCLLFTFAAFALIMHDLPFATLPSRAIFALPFLCLWLASGLSAVRRPLAVAALAGLALLYASSLANYFGGQQFHNPIYIVPSREIAQLVADQGRPGDLVVSDYDSGFPYYFGDERGSRSGPVQLMSTQIVAVMDYVGEYQPPRVWTVTLGRDRTRGETPSGLLSWLEESYRVVDQWGYAEQDAIYSRLKERVLGYPDYRYKVLVELRERR